jgi:hypothetical protein
MAGFSGQFYSLGLGGARIDRPTLTAETGQKIYEIDVPPGTTRLEASIAGASDPQADVDLYLFEATREPAILVGHSLADGSEERVAVSNPRPGKWRLVIAPYRLPNGPIQINYRDTFYHEMFGGLAIPSPENQAGLSSTLRADVSSPPVDGRILVGTIGIKSAADGMSNRTDTGPDRVPPVQTRMFEISLKKRGEPAENPEPSQ